MCFMLLNVSRTSNLHAFGVFGLLSFRILIDYCLFSIILHFLVLYPQFCCCLLIIAGEQSGKKGNVPEHSVIDARVAKFVPAIMLTS